MRRSTAPSYLSARVLILLDAFNVASLQEQHEIAAIDRQGRRGERLPPRRGELPLKHSLERAVIPCAARIRAIALITRVLCS